jgi:hypothetical protein
MRSLGLLAKCRAVPGDFACPFLSSPTRWATSAYQQSASASGGSLVRRSYLFIFLIDRGYAQDAVIKYSREYYPDRALDRAKPLIFWLPDLGSNQGPAD